MIIGTGWLLQGVWVLGQWVTKHWVSETGGKKSPELGSRKIKEGIERVETIGDSSSGVRDLALQQLELVRSRRVTRQ